MEHLVLAILLIMILSLSAANIKQIVRPMGTVFTLQEIEEVIKIYIIISEIWLMCIAAVNVKSKDRNLSPVYTYTIFSTSHHDSPDFSWSENRDGSG